MAPDGPYSSSSSLSRYGGYVNGPFRKF